MTSVATRATRAQDGWLLNGTKIWTSGAKENDWFVVLCRTSEEDDRHRGLSQLIVDLHSDGLEINPIKFLDGTAHFNEVVLTDVFVPDELVLGEVGHAWTQNTSELAYERGGPDRWLSSFLLVEQCGRLQRTGPAGRFDERPQHRLQVVRQLQVVLHEVVDLPAVFRFGEQLGAGGGGGPWGGAKVTKVALLVPVSM